MTATQSGGRRIVLGVTGGIAAYKSVTLLRLLTAAGHDVTVVPTPASLTFVGAATWAALSGNPVHTDVFEAGGAQHVHLGRQADLLIVAPATADFLARAAIGRADDLLTATLLMARCPVLLAPAMHTEMWRHPATQRNVQELAARPGHHLLGPVTGALAGGDEGEGRMAEPEDIAAAALRLLADEPQDLAGLRVVVTAGGSHEPIDPVRFIGNRSSGRQGIALAERAAARGAEVRLIAANLTVSVPPSLAASTTRVATAAELAQAVRTSAADADVVVMAAAVADFRPIAPAAAKLKRAGREELTIELERTEDILAGLVDRRAPGQTIVGFAAETGDGAASPLDLARAKARAKGADLLVCNEVGPTKGFESPDNEVAILTADGEIVDRAAGSKAQVADAVWHAVRRVRA